MYICKYRSHTFLYMHTILIHTKYVLKIKNKKNRYLEEEAMDLSSRDGPLAAGPARDGSSDEIALLVAEYALLARGLSDFEAPGLSDRAAAAAQLDEEELEKLASEVGGCYLLSVFH